ncbi:HD domain-containing protein [Candidatus Uhrbacteria bacterium]|nr:HD domain-containing protein [Candidatus Uhrbacteria bacterium]
MDLEPKKFWNFIFEMGQLRNVRHEGWRLAGVEHPDMVAAHSLRAAQIGYVLACLEGYPDPNEICAVCVFHDMEESRTGDTHRVASRYVTANKPQAAAEQVEPLGEIGRRIYGLWETMDRKDTPAGIIAKDADYLEMAVMAKEYLERGHASVRDWLNNIAKALKTESAKRLMAELEETDSYEWWDGLKKLPR